MERLAHVCILSLLALLATAVVGSPVAKLQDSALTSDTKEAPVSAENTASLASEPEVPATPPRDAEVPKIEPTQAEKAVVNSPELGEKFVKEVLRQFFQELKKYPRLVEQILNEETFKEMAALKAVDPSVVMSPPEVVIRGQQWQYMPPFRPGQSPVGSEQLQRQQRQQQQQTQLLQQQQQQQPQQVRVEYLPVNPPQPIKVPYVMPLPMNPSETAADVKPVTQTPPQQQQQQQQQRQQTQNPPLQQQEQQQQEQQRILQQQSPILISGPLNQGLMNQPSPMSQTENLVKAGPTSYFVPAGSDSFARQPPPVGQNIGAMAGDNEADIYDMESPAYYYYFYYDEDSKAPNTGEPLVKSDGDVSAGVKVAADANTSTKASGASSEPAVAQKSDVVPQVDTSENTIDGVSADEKELTNLHG